VAKVRFYSTCGNKIVSDDVIKTHVSSILNVSADDLVTKGVLSEVEPTVEDCVRFGSSGLAVIRHQQLYGSDILEAFNAVEKIIRQKEV